MLPPSPKSYLQLEVRGKSRSSVEVCLPIVDAAEPSVFASLHVHQKAKDTGIRSISTAKIFDIQTQMIQRFHLPAAD